MSKERQRRRAQREAERARAAAERARREARAARRRAVVARVTRPVTRLVPRRSGRQGGVLARRRREQNAIVAVVFVFVQVITWINLSSWTGRLAVLALSAFLVPVFVTLAFDRR